MAEINKAGDSGSLGHIDIARGQYRDQIDALTDAVRQLGGKAEIEPGNTTLNDPLSAPFILYVNSYTGSDDFAGGEYASFEEPSTATFQERFDAKMRLSLIHI